MTSGADAAVVDLLHALRPTLPDNFCREIDFIMRRTYAGTELHDKVGRIRSEMCFHLPDGIHNDAKLRAFFSGVHEANRRFFLIDNVNRTAIGDVNAERNTSLIRDHGVARDKLLVRLNCSVEHRDLICVYLLDSHQRPVGETYVASKTQMLSFK